MIAEGEATAAVIGLSRVIKNDVPRWTKQRNDEANGLQKTIEDLALQVMSTSTKLKPLKREHDYKEIAARLSVPATPAEIAGIMEKFPEEEADRAGEFLVFIQNAFAHLREIFPVSEFRTFTGPKNMLPTGDKTWGFFNQLLVLNDPVHAVFNLIGGGAMLRSQSKVVREFFPTIAETIDSSIYAAISAKTAEMTTADGTSSFRIPPRASVGLSAWLQRRTLEHNPNPKPPIAPPTGAPPKSGNGAAASANLSPSERVTHGAEDRS